MLITIVRKSQLLGALSNDPVMKEMYVSNDAHMWFAIKAGAAPPEATKKTHREIRNLYKRISLGVLYGLSAYGAVIPVYRFL